MNSTPVPFKQRKLDWIFVGFFLLNFFFITYIVDLEQLVIDNPYSYEQPVWPPAVMLKLIHWYGESFDPVLMARPQWWKMTIWVDVLLYGPFYAAAIYAFIKGRDWIRIPAFIYSGMMFMGVTVILGEEFYGLTPARNLPLVVGFNLPWLLTPVFLSLRMWREGPFSRKN